MKNRYAMLVIVFLCFFATGVEAQDKKVICKSGVVYWVDKTGKADPQDNTRRIADDDEIVSYGCIVIRVDGAIVIHEIVNGEITAYTGVSKEQIVKIIYAGESEKQKEEPKKGN